MSLQIAEWTAAKIGGRLMSCPERLQQCTEWIYRNLFLLLTLIVGFVAIVFVPQLYNIWYSGPPPIDTKDFAWILAWLLFLVTLLLGAIFTLVSVFAVPRPFGTMERVQLPVVVSHITPVWIRKLFREIYRIIDQLVNLPNRIVAKCPRALIGLLAILCFLAFWVLVVRVMEHVPPMNSLSPYPLFRPFFLNLLGWIVCFGIWLLGCTVLPSPVRLVKETSASHISFKRHADFDLEEFWVETLIISGRFLAWLAISFLLAELVWSFSHFEGTKEYVSLRSYSVWMILYVWGVSLVFAQCVDYLDLRFPYAPLRIAFIVALVGVAVTYRPAANSNVEIFTKPNEESTFTDGFAQLEEKIKSIPENQPLVIIAASGGGSRAAIFTSLVCEYLARRSLPGSMVLRGNDSRENPTWADNIVLISAVSGGSLATAHFVQRDCQKSSDQVDTRYTIGAELFSRFTTEVGRLKEEERQNIEEAKVEIDALEDPNDKLDWLNDKRELADNVDNRLDTMLKQLSTWRESSPPAVDDSPKDAWILFGSFVDDMSINFMAPILRGATTFNLDRGKALGCFWEGLFDWKNSTNLASSTGPRFIASSMSSLPAIRPLMVYNSCDVESGARIAMGFPPLPHDAFVTSSYRVTRLAPVELAHSFRDNDQIISISVSNAVRLSSNFPWGFNSVMVRGEDKKKEGGVLEHLLLDGGISDNTGIDTIYEILRGFRASEYERSKRILNRLRTRRVVLLEIDSGAKPLPPSKTEKSLGVILEPIRAMGNASYTNADLSKENFLRSIKSILAMRQFYEAHEKQDDTESTNDQPTDETVTVELTDSQRELLDDMEEVFSTRSEPANVTQITISCNHFSPKSPDKSTVMTAFALGPSDKASVIARFAYELFKLDDQITKVEESMDAYLSLREKADSLFPERGAVLHAYKVEDWVQLSDIIRRLLENIEIAELTTKQQQKLEDIVWKQDSTAREIEESASWEVNKRILERKTGIDSEELAERIVKWKADVGTIFPELTVDDLQKKVSRSPEQISGAAKSLKKAQKSIRKMNQQSQEWFSGKYPAAR